MVGFRGPMNSLSAWRIVTLLFLVLISILSLTPGDPKPDDNAFVWFIAGVPSLLQNAMHVLCYALLAVLLSRSLPHSKSVRSHRFSVFCMAVGVGVVLEVSQLLVPGRFASLSDALLNALGVILGLTAMVLAARASARNENSA